MVTRRVRKAMHKIGHLLINDGIEPGDDLYEAYWNFYKKFMKHYHSQMRVRLPRRRRKPVKFKATRNPARELQAKQILKLTKKSKKVIPKKVSIQTRIVSKIKQLFGRRKK